MAAEKIISETSIADEKRKEIISHKTQNVQSSDVFFTTLSCVSSLLTLHHTILTFNDPVRVGF